MDSEIKATSSSLERAKCTYDLDLCRSIGLGRKLGTDQSLSTLELFGGSLIGRHVFAADLIGG